MKVIHFLINSKAEVIIVQKNMNRYDNLNLPPYPFKAGKLTGLSIFERIHH
ncbi:hypothetical protein EDF67_11540 [Sphingobacterium sp. JUb78]|nr:hypothetical protein [Sphingobacterium kitahiroshimense]TCR00949.1 hypothetical protein EDF67_11540 [Sphingobacterium sp. JUb78]